MQSNSKIDWSRRLDDAVDPFSDWSGGLRYGLRHLALSGLSKIPSDFEAEFVRCIYCHYVFDDQKARFREIIRRLQEIGTFVETATVFEMLRGERPVDGRYFHFSMDDGFRNHFENAAPILEELGVPALFFIPSDYISATPEENVHYAKHVVNHTGPVRTMSWREVQMLDDWGFEIGSHTRSHARLSSLSGSELQREIAGSKRAIEEHIGSECRYISWPFGQPSDVSEEALVCIEEAGYEGCFAGTRGTVAPRRTDPFRVPRHLFEVQWPTSHTEYFLKGHFEERP